MTRGLVIVDVQNDFCEGGHLAVAGGAAVAQAVTRHLHAHAADYAHVVATRDWHVDPGPHFAHAPEQPDYATTWPVHCVAGTAGAQLHDALDRASIDEVFDKGAHAAAYSGFEGTTATGLSLGDWLHAHEVDSLDVVGIATDHCVRATALDAVRAGFATTVLLGLTAGVAAATTASALAEMRAEGVTLDGTPVLAS